MDNTEAEAASTCAFQCLRRSRSFPISFASKWSVGRACIGLAVPGRPIGPWSRRTGAPKAVATGRDWNPIGPC
jgi:hypothetical protein